MAVLVVGSFRLLFRHHTTTRKFLGKLLHTTYTMGLRLWYNSVLEFDDSSLIFTIDSNYSSEFFQRFHTLIQLLECYREQVSDNMQRFFRQLTKRSQTILKKEVATTQETLLASLANPLSFKGHAFCHRIFFHLHTLIFQRDFLWLFCTYWTFLWALKLHPFDYLKDLEPEIEWFCMAWRNFFLNNNKRFFNDDWLFFFFEIFSICLQVFYRATKREVSRGHLFNFLGETHLVMWPLSESW